MARKTCLTTEIVNAIAVQVQGGAFPYVAAQSVGIPKSTFYDWMAKGERGLKPYSELLDKVRIAGATARGEAESRVFRDKPLEWLRQGPGRSQADEPGWTNDPATVRLEGQLEHRHEVLAFHQQPGAIQTMAEAFCVLEDIGFIQRTEKGALLFGGVDADDGEAPNDD